MKYYNIVFCRHAGTSKPYIFRLPMDREVEEGDLLAAATAVGFRDDLRAVTKNMMVSEYTAHALTKVVGGHWPLAEICGMMTEKFELVRRYVPYDECEKPPEDNDELPY